VSLKAAQLEPGILTDLSIKPTDTRVQVVTDNIVSFTTATELSEGAAIKVRLPFGLTIPGFTGTGVASF